MEPVQTDFTNCIFKLPGGGPETDLPVEKNIDVEGRDVLISTWELSDEDLKQLQEVRKLDLIIWGKGHPPVALAIHNDREEENGSAVDGENQDKE
jgi:hypothetical protein